MSAAAAYRAAAEKVKEAEHELQALSVAQHQAAAGARAAQEKKDQEFGAREAAARRASAAAHAKAATAATAEAVANSKALAAAREKQVQHKMRPFRRTPSLAGPFLTPAPETLRQN